MYTGDLPEVSVDNETGQVSTDSQEAVVATVEDEKKEEVTSNTAGGNNMEGDGREADRVERERGRSRGY